MFKCAICNKDIKNTNHLKKHNISPQEYYNKYINSNTSCTCACCGKPTKFINFNIGYQSTCGHSCAGKLREANRTLEQIAESNEKRKQTYIKNFGTTHPMKNKEVQQKQAETNIKKYGTPNVWNRENPVRDIVEATMIERYDGVGWGSKKNFNLNMYKNAAKSHQENIKFIEKDLNATTQTHLVKKYGQGFLLANIVPDNMIIYDKTTNSKLIKNEFISTIEEYTYRYKNGRTIPEKQIVSAIKEIYSGIIDTGNITVINPNEIDIYLPNLKLGIEHNGNRWHSTLYKPIEYHLNKSLLCRKQGVRLIHIYEFEDLDSQIKLLQDLILGTDNYPSNDFNKNNLIDNIPQPEIIYQKEYTIYGAGKLF